MRRVNLRALLYLTLGWFGIEMAMALDATQFPVLLDQGLSHPKFESWPLGRATLISLVLSLGPLAGIIVQPLMGWMGDRLIARGVDRKRIMKQAAAYAVLGTILFAHALPLWALILAIAFFFIAFNALNVNYRAWITQTSNRRALAPYKGTVSGFIALFSGLGGFAMFMLSSVHWDKALHVPVPPLLPPVLFSAAILIITMALVMIHAPRPKAAAIIQKTVEEKAQMHALARPWNMMFYALPPLNLVPAFERRIAGFAAQRMIFRLFLIVFCQWLGIQALRVYFILYATKELHLTYQDANKALAVMTIVLVASALPLGKLADRKDNRKLLMICLWLFTIVCLLAYFVVGSMTSVLVMSVLLGMSFAGMIVLPLALLFKLCPQKSEGVYSGLYNMFMSVPQLYSLFITGWLVDYFHSYRIILLIGAVTVALAALLTLRLKTDPHPNPLPDGGD